MAQQFIDLVIRKEAINLYQEVSAVFESKDSTKYFFKNQILRASLSVSNNIAEGFERETKKELIRFCYIAKGSCGEVKSMLLLAEKMKYGEPEMIEKISGNAHKLCVLIGRFIRSIAQSNT